MKRRLIAIVGPTAVGKTASSIEFALRHKGEVISGDSMQVYRGMDIGTAKPTAEEMRGVPHHLIDIREPDEPFSAADFQAVVDQKVEEITARGRMPLLVGGTGLYVRSVLQAYTFTEMASDQALRDRLNEEEERHGPGHLHRRLAEVDPAAAARIHPNDRRRLIRALEVFELTGQRISETQVAEQSEPRYDYLLIALTGDREWLYSRIGQRVDAMLAAGWIDEVAGLHRRYDYRLTAMQALGYKEIGEYLRGRLTEGEMCELIKRNTRRFAKRQLTWFRRERQIHWIDVGPETTTNQVVETISDLVEGYWQPA